MHNGLKAKIVGGTKSEDLTIEFEDGMIVHHKKYYGVIKGTVEHPTLRLRGRNVVGGSTLGAFNINKIAFKDANKSAVYYECQCRNCGKNGILTPQEMLKHECKKGQ